MATAIICLPSYSEITAEKIRSILEELECVVYRSIDDCFELMWHGGSDINVLILEVDDVHRNEIWTCARNWPDLLLVAVYEENANMPEPLGNVALVSRLKDAAQLVGALRGLLASAPHSRLAYKRPSG